MKGSTKGRQSHHPGAQLPPRETQYQLVKLVVCHWEKDRLVLKSDLLYRQPTGQLQDQPMYQFVLPTKHQQ